MPPVFGDFLAQASGHIAAAVSIQEDLPAEAMDGIVRSLDRVVTTLARYLGDMPLPGEFDHAPTGDGPVGDVRAALDARIAVRRSAQVLRAAAAAQDDGGGEAHPAAWHLARAADQLLAGRDLLHTHCTSDPSGAWVRASSWARVIYSRPVTDALLGEIGGVAAQLAPWMMRLSMNPPPGSIAPATTGLTLHDSSRWLWTAGLKLYARSLKKPPAGDARLVLASIPSGLPPAHHPVAAAESVHELCQGVVTTAARLQHAAYAFARTARWSPQATSYTWGRDALACAITSHSSEVIIRGLAHRASALGLDPLVQAHLDNAARALNPVCTAWRAIAGEWDLLSTGTNHGRGVSRVAHEIGDLVLRIGRLAYANPGWTPASGDSLPRSPAGLAPAAADLRVVLTAIHHAHRHLGLHRCHRPLVRPPGRSRRQALYPHPPASRRLRHPPPSRSSPALTRHPSTGWLPPGRQDLHRRHRSLRRPRRRRRDPIPCARSRPRPSGRQPATPGAAARTTTGLTRRRPSQRQATRQTP